MRFLVMAAAALALSSGASAQDDWRAQALADLPEVGELHLQFLVNDQPDGFMRLGWAKVEEEGVIRFYDRTMWASQEIYETLGGTIDLTTFAPIDTAIRFHQASAILTVEVAAQDGVMVGGQALTQPFVGQQAAEISVPITEGMVSRGSVFFLAQSLPIDAGESLTFDWFAPLSNAAETVTVTAFDAGSIDTISGTHNALRLEVRGSNPENDIYVTNNEGLRQIVRIDVIGQPMRFEAYPTAQPATE